MSLRGCLTAQSARHRLYLSPCDVQHVDSGIVVSVENQSAVRASVRAFRQRLSLGRLAPTSAANLRRSTRVHEYNLLSGAFCLESDRAGAGRYAGPKGTI